jgi:hypothetical protein
MSVRSLTAPWLRLLLCAAVAAPTIVLHKSAAYAAPDDEDKDKKKDDDQPDDEEDNKPDPEQPKVTAGGNFTMENYALAEVERPLTITVGMIEARLDLVADISNGTAFDNWFIGLTGRYGLYDVLELQVGALFNLRKGMDAAVAIDVGAELAIIYDLVDFRLTLDLPVNPSVDLNVVLGFPIKYRFSDKIAIIAAERLLTIPITSGAKPIVTLTVGGMFQAIEALAIIVRATVNIPTDNTDLITIPIEVDLQYTPSRHIDIGLELRLDNLKADQPFDARSAGLFARVRF